MLLLDENRLTEAIAPVLLAAGLPAMKELGIGIKILPVRARHALRRIPHLD